MITITQGQNYTKVLEMKYADTLEPVDLTGITAYSQMRTEPAPNGQVVATAVCTVDNANHTVTVVYPSTQTEEIALGDYGYDIWLMDECNRKLPIYSTRCRVIGRYTDNFGGE